MWQAIAIQAGLSAVSGIISSKKKNRALAARQAWIQQEKKHAKEMYELQTFKKYYDKEAQGARRIALSAGLGGGISGARVLNQFDEVFLQTDLHLDSIRHEHELKRIDNSINMLQRQKTSPLKSGFMQGLLGGVQGFIDHGASFGGSGDTTKKKVPSGTQTTTAANTSVFSNYA